MASKPVKQATANQNNLKIAGFNKASQLDTLRKTSALTPSSKMRNLMNKMRDIEISADLPSYQGDTEGDIPEPKVTTTTLPAVVSKSLRAAGKQTPELHQVASLPGNIQNVIRQLGASLFKQFTRTPTKNIYVIANLMGNGPNTNLEVQAVANWLKTTGKDLGPGNVNFDQIIPGYDADIHQYSAAGVRWLLVSDMGGQYIYSWPEHESVNLDPTKQLK